MPSIKLDHITKTYHNTPVLQDFSYEFKDGKIYFIMGASGVGKTTLLRLILGLEQAEQGTIQIKGRCAVVFQENRIVEELSPITNVKMVFKNISEETVKHALMQVLPENCLYGKSSELSGGMKRRVAIVRAMLSDSDYVVMDEPFTGLDEKSKKMMMEYILREQKSRTVLMVSHDESEAAFMGGEICLLTTTRPVATITEGL